MERYNDELPDILGRIGGECIIGRKGVGPRTYLYQARTGPLGYVLPQRDGVDERSYQTTLTSWRGTYR